MMRHVEVASSTLGGEGVEEALLLPILGERVMGSQARLEAARERQAQDRSQERGRVHPEYSCGGYLNLLLWTHVGTGLDGRLDRRLDDLADVSDDIEEPT